MLTKLVLSTGEITGRVEKYVMDLFQMNLHVYEGDVPFSDIGFNFQLGDVKKDELLRVIREKAYGLCKKVSQMSPMGVKVEIESINLLSEDRAVLSVRVNDERENFEIEI
jgi:hypothetical protein